MGSKLRIVLIGLVIANGALGVLIASTNQVGAVPSSSSSAPEFSDQLTLVTEMSAQVEAPPPKPHECRVWGPERDPALFAELQNRLESEGGFPEITESVVVGAPDFLVYVEGLGSRDAVRRVAKELEAQGIESYPINRDDGERVLSIGVFSQSPRAQRLLSRVASLGYKTGIEELLRNQTVYHLTAHIPLSDQAYASSISGCVEIAQRSGFL